MTTFEMATSSRENAHGQYPPVLQILYRQYQRISRVQNLQSLPPDTTQRMAENGTGENDHHYLQAYQDSEREDTAKARRSILILLTHLWSEGPPELGSENWRETLGGNGESPAPMKGVDDVIRLYVAAGGTELEVKAGREAVS